ncbi:hypothetical protein [Sandaracinus amylolyticus]|uniref:Uncharacterized protein n=1 Tax=Sandaracinus amylolyticus TaxID=927083 RepID=A0A0F6YHB5_9BACT|nr:hypothetical protein [Sandaracinus amylolyticus]AKF03832.1 hypothetical protein DB32_000981 [Sandaracinus amylolyticus]
MERWDFLRRLIVITALVEARDVTGAKRELATLRGRMDDTARSRQLETVHADAWGLEPAPATFGEALDRVEALVAAIELER